MDTVKIVCEKTEDNDQGFIIINRSDLSDNDKIFVKKPIRKEDTVKQKDSK